MKSHDVKAVAPATSANLGSGFDVFSVALDILFDTVHAEMIDENRIEIRVEGPGAESIPVEPDLNTAGIVAKALLNLSKRKHGLKIKIEKGTTEDKAWKCRKKILTGGIIKEASFIKSPVRTVLKVIQDTINLL